MMLAVDVKVPSPPGLPRTVFMGAGDEGSLSSGWGEVRDSSASPFNKRTGMDACAASLFMSNRRKQKHEIDQPIQPRGNVARTPEPRPCKAAGTEWLAAHP